MQGGNHDFQRNITLPLMSETRNRDPMRLRARESARAPMAPITPCLMPQVDIGIAQERTQRPHNACVLIARLCLPQIGQFGVSSSYPEYREMGDFTPYTGKCPPFGRQIPFAPIRERWAIRACWALRPHPPPSALLPHSRRRIAFASS